eukprot:1848465-Pyramimonas_sp.AAC.1
MMNSVSLICSRLPRQPPRWQIRKFSKSQPLRLGLVVGPSCPLDQFGPIEGGVWDQFGTRLTPWELGTVAWDAAWDRTSADLGTGPGTWDLASRLPI